MYIGNHYPGGKYICLFDGNGELEFSNAAQGKPAGKGRYAVDVDPARGFIALRVRKTDPKSPIKNIRLVKAEHEKTQQTQPFSPDLLKRYKGFQVIRFMDWQRTNNSKIEKWDQRALPTDATQASEKGVALEYCVQLANTLDADPWLCIPHKADDDYVRQFAALVKKQLNPKRKVYVEYSNETWNTIFDQAKYCKEKGLALGLSTNEYEAQLRYSAQRSVEIFKIFEKEFGGKDRLVRVLCAHSANPWTGTTTMDWKQASKSADAIAIAPYFGNAYGDAKTADKVAEMSVDELLDGCKKMIADNRKKNETYAAEAKKRGLKLMAYESGQHLAGVGGAENNEKLTNLFHAANRHPRMKELYLEDLLRVLVRRQVLQVGELGQFGVVGPEGRHGPQDDGPARVLEADEEVIIGSTKPTGVLLWALPHREEHPCPACPFWRSCLPAPPWPPTPRRWPIF